MLHANVNIDILFAYLLTDVAREIFEDNRREYGNGLQKFEPNDLNKAMMLDLTLLDKKTENEIMKERGFNRIYDCGNKKYILKISH